MTAPKNLDERITTLDTRMSTADQRLTALETAVTRMAAKEREFTRRLGELESVAQGFQNVMEAISARVSTLESAKLPPAEERLHELEVRVANNMERIGRIETARTKGGKLSTRLATIEAILTEMSGQGEPTVPDPTKV